MKHRHQFVRQAALGLLMAFAVAGCGGTGQEQPGGLRIGMTCMDLTNPFFKLICNVMQEEASAHGYTVVCLGDVLRAQSSSSRARPSSGFPARDVWKP